MIDGNGPGAVTLGAGDRASAIAAVKAVLRMVTTDEDALIAALGETALALAELFTGRVLIARAMTDRLPASAAWQRLEAAPVRAISGVAAATGAGAVTLGAQAYAVDIDADGDGWVRVIDAGAAMRVTVSFTAGLADDWAGLPAPIRQGVALLAAHLFSERDERAAPPAAVTALWRPFRRIALRPAPCGTARSC